MEHRTKGAREKTNFETARNLPMCKKEPQDLKTPPQSFVGGTGILPGSQYHVVAVPLLNNYNEKYSWRWRDSPKWGTT